jgi:hypothetical protein
MFVKKRRSDEIIDTGLEIVWQGRYRCGNHFLGA